jgi:hypothetical protein
VRDKIEAQLEEYLKVKANKEAEESASSQQELVTPVSSE